MNKIIVLIILAIFGVIIVFASSTSEGNKQISIQMSGYTMIILSLMTAMYLDIRTNVNKKCQ